jgi:3,4-dihydroxy 2-butanone 4-phosphate synthase / GTP cyclohydrolase II
MVVDKLVDDMKSEFVLNSIVDAVEDIKNGKVVIVVDDEDRENEGDFICAAECVTPEIINFMATHGRGLICAPITEIRAKELKLSRMVTENTDMHETAFTVSIDYKKKGCTTGISAYDRATGIQALVDEGTLPEDYARPGHIFPLIAREGGVLRRTGHTEASIDLAVMAGFKPAGVLIEILNADGSMARLPQLVEIAKRFELKIISIKDLVAFRMASERLVRLENTLTIETKYGDFDMLVFKETNTGISHLVLKKGRWDPDESILTRVHSGSNIAEIFAFFLKDTNRIIHDTLRMIEDEGKGVLILLRQKEDENSLNEIVEAMKTQKSLEEPINPYFKRNMENEQKDFGIGAQILHDLKIRKIRLLTNNPKKRVGLIGYDLEIVDNIPL